MRTRRPTAAAAAVATFVAFVSIATLAGCAQNNATQGTSFSSLTSAAAQGQTWVDGAVNAAVPAAPAKTTTSLPSEACDSNSGRNAARYEVTVRTTKNNVDTATLAAWHALEGDRFTLSAASAPDSGTDPIAPRASAPSWTITGAHDGFQAEVVGDRNDPSVRVRVITPCFGT